MKKVIETIRKHGLISENQHIVLGLSGGPDSVCLFHVLNRLSEEMKLTLHPVHINHKFRPGAAERDQAYVEELCRKMGLECRTFVVDCNAIATREKMTGEEAGRMVRYKAFAQVAEELETGGVSKDDIRIAVAQNADDQAETILFRILRGTGTDGLSGISYKRRDEKGYLIIRPLLDVTKAQVMDYCRENQLNPCMDHTNQEAIYTRNKIRLELIPYLQREYNSNIKETIIRMGKTAAIDGDYLAAEGAEAYREALREKGKDYIILSGKVLKDCHRAIRRRILSEALKELGLGDDVSFANFQSVESILLSESPSARTDLPRGYYATRVYEDLKLCRRSESQRKEGTGLRIRVMTIEEFNGLSQEPDRESFAAFDFDKMAEVLGTDFDRRIHLGKREAGDYLPIGETKRKKIQDYYVDRKIPKDERDEVELVKIGHEVLWVLPWRGKGRFSPKYKLGPDTKKVICIEKNCEL